MKVNLIRKILEELFFAFLVLSILEIGSRELLYIGEIRNVILKGENDIIARLRWVDRRKRNIQITFPFDKFDPTKGWVTIPNASNILYFENKLVSSNSKGIRGTVEYQYARDKKKLRILFLGDSFTFGDEVDDNETYPYYLQQMLPNTEVINLGVHGYGHDQMLIYLKEEGVKYKPDIIVLGYVGADTHRNMREFEDYAKPRFKLMNNKLEVCNFPVPTPEAILMLEPWRSRFIDLLNILKFDIYFKSESYKKEKDRITKAILTDLATTAKGIDAVPVFVYLDSARNKEYSPGLTKEEKRFLSRCDEILVNCTFVRSKIYSARMSGVKIKDYGHFDSETNRLVALGIKEYLFKNGFLKKD